jgi:hypothetical protein
LEERQKNGRAQQGTTQRPPTAFDSRRIVSGAPEDDSQRKKLTSDSTVKAAGQAFEKAANIQQTKLNE